MSQPSTQSLRELIAKWRSRCASINPAIRSTTRILAAELEALLPALESALVERQELDPFEALKRSREPHKTVAKLLDPDDTPAAPTERLRGLAEQVEVCGVALADAELDCNSTHPGAFRELSKLREMVKGLAAHEAQQAEGKPTGGDSARELAHLWLMNERSDCGSDTQEEAEHSLANLIAGHAEQCTSRAVAQARVDEFDLIVRERPADPIYWDKHHRADLERDLAAIAKETK